MELRRIDSLDLKPEVESQLSLMMSKVTRGDDNVIRGPLADVPNIHDLFMEWFEAMLLKMPLNETLLEAERANQDKFGPRSIALPWSDRKAGVLAYYEVDDTLLPKIELPQTVKGRLRPMSLKTATEYIKKTTNSGLPYLRKKGLVLKEAVTNFKQLLARQDPCVLFTRTQEGKKTRPVWGFPIADTLNEMMFYRPLLDFQKNSG